MPQQSTSAYKKIYRYIPRTYIMDKQITKSFNKLAKRELNQYDGCICISDDGEITTAPIKPTICNRLIAYSNVAGYYISEDGTIKMFPMPVKTNDAESTSLGCTPKIDNKKLKEIIKNIGLPEIISRNMPQTETANHIMIKQGEAELPKTELATRKIISLLKRILLPKLQVMNEYYIRELTKTEYLYNSYNFSRFSGKPLEPQTADTLIQKTMLYAQSLNCTFDFQEIADQYNFYVLYRTIALEKIKEFPETSTLTRIASNIISEIPDKRLIEWEKSNITETMRKENLNTDIMSVITKINRPSIERLSGNENMNTFDIVRVRLGIVTKSTMPERDKYLRENQKRIAQIALAKIKDYKPFQKYGVPVNVLKTERMTITCSGELEIIFALKPLGKETKG